MTSPESIAQLECAIRRLAKRVRPLFTQLEETPTLEQMERTNVAMLAANDEFNADVERIKQEAREAKR